MVAVSDPLPYLYPYIALCRVMVHGNLLFMMNAQTFQMTYTNPITLYYPPTLRIITTILYVSATGMRPS